jgi:Domain of unknown function (DUF4271)
MFKKVLLFSFLLIAIFAISANAKQTQIPVDSLQNISLFTDSVDTAAVLVLDTITPKFLKPLDSTASALISDSLSKDFGFPKLDLEELNRSFRLNSIKRSVLQDGLALPKGEIWVIAFIAFLLVLFAALKQNFSKQLIAIIQSFFSNRALSNLNKEDNLFTSWPFLLLFIQFGFIVGMFFYLVAKNQNGGFVTNGIQSYLSISVIIIVLYVLKILLLRLLGVIFNVQKPVNEYVSILYLSYFNCSLLFTPLVVAFAITPLKHTNIYIYIAIILVSIIFVFQFIRAGVNILSHYRFSKVYLFLYFCTLEICPILILIKTIGF